MANEVLIYGVKVEAGEGIKKLADLKKALADNAAEQKNLTAQFKEGAIAEDKYLQEIVKLQQASRVLSGEQKKEQRDLDLTQKARAANVGSLVQMREELKRGIDAYIAFSKEQRESAEGQAFLKGLNDQRKAVEEVEKSMGNHTRGVGRYKEAFSEAIESSGLFSNQLGMLTQIQNTLTGVLKIFQVEQTEANAAIAAGGPASAIFANGMKVVKLALLGTGIGAFLLVIGSLIAFFKRTEEGAEMLERAMAGVGAVVDVVVGSFAAMGKSLVETFSSPKQAVKDLGDFIATNLVNRVKAFGVIWSAVQKGDFKGGVNGLVQLGTGIEDSIGKAGRLGTSLKKVGDEAASAAKAYMNITQAAQDLEDKQLAAGPQNEKLKGQIEQLMLQARERGKSERERIAGLKEAGKLEEQLTKQRLQFAQEEMSLALRREQLDRKAGKLDNATRSEEAVQAEVKYQQILNESANQRQQIANRESGLMQELQADREKAQKDALEKQAALQLKQLQSEKAAIETRLLGVEQGSFAELKIREELLKKELQIELLNSELSKNQRILATAKVNHEIEKLEKERTDKQKAGSKEANKKMLEDTLSATEKAYNQMELNAKESLARQEISEEGYNTQLAMLHYQRLQTQLADLQEYVGLVEGIEQQIADKQVEIANTAADSRISANERIKISSQEAHQKEVDRLVAIQTQTAEFVESIGQAYTDSLDEQGLDLAKFSKNIMGVVLDTLEKVVEAQVLASIGMATVGSAVQADSIATFGVTGAIRAGILIGIIKAAFAVFKGAINKFEDGGILQGPSHSNGGIQLFNKNTGAYFGEAQGGEPILVKGVSQNPALLAAASAINVAAGGKPLTSTPFMNDGGLVSRYVSGPAIQQQAMSDTVTQQIKIAIENLPPIYTRVTDIDRVQNKGKVTSIKTNI